MVQFTTQEIQEIRKIARDPRALSPFSGMIFNKSVDAPDQTIDELVKRAVKVKLRIQELGE